MKKRIKEIFEYKGLSLEELEQITGISKYIWGNLFTGKQRVNEDHINSIIKLWPEYAYWLTTGETIPNAGQISPEVDKARENLKKVG
jgi:transcriptional regulator with XRE-family HTH domain